MSLPISAGVGRAARRFLGTVVVAILGTFGGASAAYAWEFDIAGTTVAFRDGTPGGDTDIWLYDLGTRKYTRATNTSEDAEQALALAGQRVYFLRNGTPDALDVYDLASGQPEQDVADFYWIDMNGPSADAGHLVFAASQSTGFSPQAIYVVDASTDSPPERISPTEPETLLTPTTGNCARTPDIDYPWVVWFDNERLDCNQLPGRLYARNLETGATKIVAAPSCFCTAGFQVSDGKVAIIETEGGHRVLALYDLAADTRTVLSLPTEPSSTLLSDFRGSRIVYAGGIYDLTTGQVTANSGPARLSGNWTVYPTESNAKLVAENLQSGETRVIRPRPPDRDGDGFGDADDQCPDVFGVAPTGCPAIEPSTPSPSSPPLSPPAPLPSRDFIVRAIGDSVTAGFGYDGDGTPVRTWLLIKTCRPKPSDHRCQSPNLLAYPAVWAKSVGIPRIFPMFANYAMSGSRPEDWADARGQFRKRLDQVVEENPDVVFVTLGGNPLLEKFAFGLLGQACIHPNVADQLTRACVRRKLVEQRAVPRLIQVYSRLLDAPTAKIGIFLYHKAYPRTIVLRSKADILFSELNAAIATAVTQTWRKRPGDARRLKLLRPPPFDGHLCGSDHPWVLNVDTCIHPNIAGQRQYARIITRRLFPSGIGTSG